MYTTRDQQMIRPLTTCFLGLLLMVLSGCQGTVSAPPDESLSPTSSGDFVDPSIGLGAPGPGPGADVPAGLHTQRPEAGGWSIFDALAGLFSPSREDVGAFDIDPVIRPFDPTTGHDSGGESEIGPPPPPVVLPIDDEGRGESDVEPIVVPDDGIIGGHDVFQSGTLTAGSFDDNLNLDVFLNFVSGFLQSNLLQQWPEVTLGDRAIITVLDETGEPVGNARVVVTVGGSQQQAAQTVLDIPTRSDGRVLYATGVDGAGDATSFTVEVYPPDGSAPVIVSTDLTGLDWKVTLPGVSAVLPTQLDLAFVVDATGSMSDELQYLQAEMEDIVLSVADAYPDVDQHYALIVYRDQGDAYVTHTFDFTASRQKFQADLFNQSALAGGDYPEAMHEALEEAETLSWRGSDTARVLFLVADAPPHEEYAQRALDAVMGIRSMGVAIYPVAASGVADEAEFIMRSAALLTLSEYCFLTDDSGVGNSHAEPHIPCYDVQRLDQLMVRLISSELEGRRLYAESEDIIRTVGSPVNGVCADEQDPNGQH